MEPNLRPDLPDEGVSPITGKKEATSAGKFMGWNTIHDKSGGRHALHDPLLDRPSAAAHLPPGRPNPDCHDHPWDFWTFPLTSYVEEVAVPYGGGTTIDGETVPLFYEKVKQIVPAWRLTARAATHTHRVLGRYTGPKPRRDLDLYAEGRILWPYELYATRPIITLVWRSEIKRKWGFLKTREGKWCWTPWKEYVFGTGKSAPCE